MAKLVALPSFMPVATALCAFALVGTLVGAGSRAAFTDTTGNAGSAWSAGEVTLTDDASGSAMFTTTAMVPGSTVSNCITVTYTGSTGGAQPEARLYATAGASSTLNPDLNAVIEQGSLSTLGDCSTFAPAGQVASTTLAALIVGNGDYASGVDAWQPITGDTRTYRFTITLDSSTGDSQQGTSGSADFTWEVQVSA